MVGTFDQPDFQTDTGTAYKTAIDNSIAVVGALAGQFAAHEQSSPNMTVRVDAGKLLSGTTLTEVAGQNTGTITAPVGNPRIDRVVINASTGVVSVITGTPAGSPTPPAITSGNIPIAQVSLTPSTTAITNAIITDERPVSFSGGVSDGDKGDITVSGGGGTWTLDKNATLQTVFGAVSTKLTTLQTIASASTTNLGSITNSNIISITGTTTITSFGSSADVANPLYFIRFTGALTLTHNGTSLILPASANITTAAGDAAIMEYLGSGNWRCLNYQRANGLPVTNLTASQLLGVGATGREVGITLGTGLSMSGTTLNGSAGAMELISTATPSAASVVDFTGLNSTYFAYVLLIDLDPSTSPMELWLRHSTDNGSTYISTGSRYASNNSISGTLGVSDQIVLTASSTDTDERIQGAVRLLNLSVANTHKYSFGEFISVGSTSNVRAHISYGSTPRAALAGSNYTSAVNAIRILPSTGTVTGTVKLYGIRA